MEKELIKWMLFLFLAIAFYVVSYIIGGSFLHFITNTYVSIVTGIILMIITLKLIDIYYKN